MFSEHQRGPVVAGPLDKTLLTFHRPKLEQNPEVQI